MDKYSNQLFDYIYDDIGSRIESQVSSLGLTFEGMWAFLYQQGANSLKSCYYKLRENDLTNEDKTAIEEAFVNCDEGSLGAAFNTLKVDSTKYLLSLPNTFNEARGVVCLIDSKIKQQHAIFLMVKNSYEDKTEVYGMLDLFFSDNKGSDEVGIDKKLDLLKTVIDKILEDKNFNTHCLSAFITKRYETLFDDNDILGNKNIEEEAIGKIEKILSLFSETPLFHIEKNNSQEKYVGINFDFIHSTIKYQYRYCSLINDKPDCPHYCCSPNLNDTSCSNSFLKNYFYDIMSSLGWKLYQCDEIEVLSNRYKIKYWSKNEINKTSIIECINTKEIQAQIDIFKKYSNINELARNKFIDEIVFSYLKSGLKNNVGVLAIERAFKPHLITKKDCNSDYLRKDILPSELLYQLYQKDDIDKNILEKVENNERNNTVHIEILDGVSFKSELKKQIKNNTDDYYGYLKGYLIVNNTSLEVINDLSFHYLGNNPFKIELIKGKINEQALQISSVIQQKEVEKHATRAAISQVMARNMSHNIGSHVLSNMVTEISVESHFPKEQYKSLYDTSLYTDKDKTFNKHEWKLANFNSYLRTRMDFLADIATGQPAMEVTRSLVRDVVGEMDKNRILLNHISGVDNFEYSIVVKDCREFKLVHCSNHECGCDGKEKDIPVSIPNGIMGYHALYILIENIIRNTAKHQGSTSTLENRIFTLEIRDSKIDNTLYEVLLYDNVPIGGDFIVDKDFFKKYTEKEYIPEENKFHTRLDWLVFQQNCRLNSSVINPSTSRLRDGAWGLIEMDAAAAYLRKFAPESIDENIYNLDVFIEENRGKKDYLNILKAVKKGDHLAYRFHMMKPKELLVVDETETGILYNELQGSEKDGKTKHNQLLENGIWVMQTTNPNSENYFDINSVYAHPFMLIFAGDNFNINNYLYTKIKKDEVDGLFRGNLPTRIIVCKDENTRVDKEDTPWITYIDSKHDLMKVLRESTDLIRVIPKSTDDLNKQTLMDRVWQVWLNHKVKYHKIIKTNTESINDYILSIDKNTNEESTLLIKLAWHATQKDIDNRGNNHFLAFPSSVKTFIDNTQEDLVLKKMNELSVITANEHFDKIGLAILTDSFLTKILVIDERVQMSWCQKYPGTTTEQQILYEYGELFSPEKRYIDLSQQTYNPNYGESIEDLIESINLKPNLKGLDYIVIHLGVIEKILTANKLPKKKENVRDFVLLLQNKLSSKTRIVITSGRGKPDNLPEQVPFVSFSTLSQYTIETPFKPFLNQIIQNSRTFKN